MNFLKTNLGQRLIFSLMTLIMNFKDLIDIKVEGSSAKKIRLVVYLFFKFYSKFCIITRQEQQQEEDLFD